MTPLTYTDIGANLLHTQFDPDRAEVIRRACTAGVTHMLVTCTNLDESARGVEFCRGQPADGEARLGCTAGVHPHDAKDIAPGWIASLSRLAGNAEVKALGEMGLDFNRNFSPRDCQIEVFRAQLAVAAEIGKPVFVHDRDSDGLVYELLLEQASALTGVVVHCFTGTSEDLTRYLDAGFYIGITGWVCDERRGQQLRDMVTDIPLDQLLVETDAPFLFPHNVPASQANSVDNPGNRKRNEPVFLTYVVETIAQLHHRDPAEIAHATHRNASTLFNLHEDV